MSSAKRKERYINLNGPAVSLASSGCAPWLRIWQLHVLRISQNKSNNTRLHAQIMSYLSSFSLILKSIANFYLPTNMKLFNYSYPVVTKNTKQKNTGV